MFNILLVEDNPGDAKLSEKAFLVGDVEKKLSIVDNGKKALDFIFKRNEFVDAETPDLVLLDLNLPGLSGHDVLQEIKSNESYKYIPVIILSTSTSPQDIEKCYRLQANCYLSKPAEFKDFIKLVAKLESFWMKTVRLPSFT